MWSMNSQPAFGGDEHEVSARKNLHNACPGDVVSELGFGFNVATETDQWGAIHALFLLWNSMLDWVTAST
jgi:hypothetical protein